MMRIATLILGFLVFSGYSLAASANPAFCGHRTEVVQTLSNSYSENPTAMGLAAGGGMLEVFSSKNGTWTIILTLPTGISCVIAAGEEWESLPQIAIGSTT